MVDVGETDNVLAVEPVFQLYVVAPDAVNEVDCPLQMVEEFTVIVGKGFTLTVAIAVLVHPAVVPVTV